MILNLLKSQRDQIFELVARFELPHAEFTWRDGSADFAGWVNEKCPYLVHKPTDFVYRVARTPPAMDNWAIAPLRRAGGEYSVSYSPANERFEATAHYQTWPEVLLHVQHWLGALCQEIDSPDLWSQASVHAHELRALSGTRGSEPFSAVEIPILESRIEEIAKDVIREANIIGDDLAELRAEVAEVKAELRKLNRRQWARSILGWIVTLGGRYALESHFAAMLLGKAMDGLRLVTGE